MRQIRKLLALAICSALINTASALEDPSNDDSVADPAQMEKGATLKNAAQIQRAENLVQAVQDNLAGATEKAEQTIEISQFLVDDARQVIDQAQAELDAINSEDAEALLYATQNLEQARQTLSAALSSLEKANQQLDNISEVSPESISEMRASGMGWGEIAKQLDVHPGLLGLGHSKSSKKNQNASSDAETVDKRSNSAVNNSSRKSANKKSNGGGNKGNGGNSGGKGGNSGGKGGKKK